MKDFNNNFAYFIIITVIIFIIISTVASLYTYSPIIINNLKNKGLLPIKVAINNY